MDSNSIVHDRHIVAVVRAVRVGLLGSRSEQYSWGIIAVQRLKTFKTQARSTVTKSPNRRIQSSEMNCRLLLCLERASPQTEVAIAMGTFVLPGISLPTVGDGSEASVVNSGVQNFFF